ncbi:MAG: DUF721 domain-containing protein [Bacteroidales bacterium]
MRRTNERSLGEIIREVLKEHRLEGKVNEARVASAWSRVMGQNISRYTTAVYLNGSSLKVCLRSSVLRSELSMGREKIVSMLNRELGGEVVSEIIFS